MEENFFFPPFHSGRPGYRHLPDGAADEIGHQNVPCWSRNLGKDTIHGKEKLVIVTSTKNGTTHYKTTFDH
jgi:hypothetical protein